MTSPPAYLSLFIRGNYIEDRLAKAIDFDRMRRRRWIRPSINYTSPSVRENPAIGVNFASSGTAILDINSAVDVCSIRLLFISKSICHLCYFLFQTIMVC